MILRSDNGREDNHMVNNLKEMMGYIKNCLWEANIYVIFFNLNYLNTK